MIEKAFIFIRFLFSIPEYCTVLNIDRIVYKFFCIHILESMEVKVKDNDSGLVREVAFLLAENADLKEQICELKDAYLEFSTPE